MLKIVTLIVLCIAVAQPRAFTIRNRKFYDSKGGEVIFHGLNLMQKFFPYTNDVTQEHIQQMVDMGMNAIRTDVTWAGYETSRGVYDQAYLQKKIDLINRLGKRGIYTLLEFHQDMFAQRIGGNGAPGFIIPDDYVRDFPKPMADPEQFDENWRWVSKKNPDRVINFAEYYTTYACNRAFRGLYNNEHGMLDSFAQYWRRLARAFKDNPYIIGYELMNEPWPGNMYKNPLCMIPGLSQVFNLQHAFDVVARAIRQVDPDQNIGFEPVTWLNAIPAGFSHAPGGKQFADRSFLCWHYYSPPTYGMDIYMAARKLDMKRLGVGGLLTQFMAVPGTAIDPQKYYPQILNKCDKYHVGWFAWQWQPNINKEMVVRTYVQRIGGNLVQQKYDAVSKKFMLYYQANKQAGQTIIFFAKNYYPNGFILTTDPKLKYQIRESKYVVIDSKDIGNRLVTVKIERPEGQMEGRGERVWHPQPESNKQEGRKMIKQEQPQQQRMNEKKQQREEIKKERSRSRSKSGQKRENKNQQP